MKLSYDPKHNIAYIRLRERQGEIETLRDQRRAECRHGAGRDRVRHRAAQCQRAARRRPTAGRGRRARWPDARAGSGLSSPERRDLPLRSMRVAGALITWVAEPIDLVNSEWSSSSLRLRTAIGSSICDAGPIWLRSTSGRRGVPSSRRCSPERAFSSAQFALVVEIGRAATKSQVFEALGSGTRSRVRRQPR